MKAFRWPLIISATLIALAGIVYGPNAGVQVATIGLLVLGLSVDNAVVNASTLQRMSPLWQNRFMTYGIFVATFGMGAIFPIGIVSVVAQLLPWDALTLAFSHQNEYAVKLLEAHPAVVGFGAFFLVMVHMKWLFVSRDIMWLTWLERRLSVAGRIEAAHMIVATVILVVSAYTIAWPHDRESFLLSGLAGIVAHAIINGLADMLGTDDETGVVAAGGGMLFAYLEVQDASFSFDGVIGAFAVTTFLLLITAGVAIGAMLTRALTVQAVRHDVLKQFIYVEHGAHWAIGLLWMSLIASLRWDIPDVAIGIATTAVIAASVVSSRRAMRRKQEQELEGQMSAAFQSTITNLEETSGSLPR